MTERCRVLRWRLQIGKAPRACGLITKGRQVSVTTSSTVTIGRRQEITVSLEEALTVTIGFAFGVADLNLDYGRDNPYLYAYRSYDCALRNDAPGLSEADVFASAGLNSGIDSAVMLRLLAIIDNDPTLPNLATVPEFWLLSPDCLRRDPGPGCPEHELWEIWRRLTKLEGVAGAVASKVIHHRWDTKFALFDSRIARIYHGDESWAEICEDLQHTSEWWEELERQFDCYRVKHQNGRGVSLRRLRLLDILAWAQAARYWEHLLKLGTALLNSTTDPRQRAGSPITGVAAAR